MNHKNNTLAQLLERLRKIASRGPVLGIDRGDSSVGITLLRELGIEHTSSSKPSFGGIVVTAARRLDHGRSNRVNLFAKVPDWTLSTCKSSREILDRYGYNTPDGVRRLYCTVSSKRANSQGLRLRLRAGNQILEEFEDGESQVSSVAAWSMDVLRKRLLDTHPESIWVKATVHRLSGREHFFYREATYTGRPRADILAELLNTGTVSIDHLILQNGNRVTEKGPLFKIEPDNLELLFPERRVYTLV
jgi:hypothetical protein